MLPVPATAVPMGSARFLAGAESFPMGSANNVPALETEEVKNNSIVDLTKYEINVFMLFT
jgi:hypothetical protein